MSNQMPEPRKAAARIERDGIRTEVELAMARQRELNDAERAERRAMKLARQQSAGLVFSESLAG